MPLRRDIGLPSSLRFDMSQVLKIAVPVPIRRIFDYLVPNTPSLPVLQPGLRVLVPFGRIRKVGVLLGITDDSEIETTRLKRAIAVLDETPLLSGRDLELLAWASRYYHHPIGEALAAAFTPLLRRGESAVPETSRFLCASPLGMADADQQLKRAPRQAELFHQLLEAPEGLLPEALAALGWDWRGAAAALEHKGLAVWRESASRVIPAGPTESPSLAPRLNADQEAAVAAVRASLGRHGVFLLEGITGSGKTEVYLRLAEEVLARGEQAMVLLPEISLTPQLEARFRARFSAPVAVFHSGLGENQRRRAWLAMQQGEAGILLGTRSAVFTPLKSPGLFVLDEEHDPSFKQQEGFRYSARDVAVMRAKLAQVPVLLGSATPSLESLHNARCGRYRLLRLPKRAGGARLPEFRVLDIRGQRLREGLSLRLEAAIGDTLKRGEQALLFINRRGFAPTLTCHACGWIAQCPHCDSNQVIHAAEGRLRCHHCGREEALVAACPACGARELLALGLGTERVESALAERFPSARIVRLDRDNTRHKGRLQNLLEEIRAGQIDLLIGTQMLAKGHHFPEVTLVGILDVDAGFYSVDFRATERTAQLIVQVAGRAGREEKPGIVLLQTRHPEHPLLQVLVRRGYAGLAEACLSERAAAVLPPFSHQALWRAEADDAGSPQRFLRQLAECAGRQPDSTLRVLGPAPAPLARRAGRHRWQLLLQAEKRSELHAAVDQVLAAAQELGNPGKVRWSIDIDPADLY